MWALVFVGNRMCCFETCSAHERVHLACPPLAVLPAASVPEHFLYSWEAVMTHSLALRPLLYLQGERSSSNYRTVSHKQPAAPSIRPARNLLHSCLLCTASQCLNGGARLDWPTGATQKHSACKAGHLVCQATSMYENTNLGQGKSLSPCQGEDASFAQYAFGSGRANTTPQGQE
jgi:hypothetical protein